MPAHAGIQGSTLVILHARFLTRAIHGSSLSGAHKTRVKNSFPAVFCAPVGLVPWMARVQAGIS